MYAKQVKKLNCKEMHEDSKMLLTNKESIDDHTTCEFIDLNKKHSQREELKRNNNLQMNKNFMEFFW